jgi:L-methionine (R)-S-oxide reductase
MNDLVPDVQRWLEAFLREQGAVAGTVHTLDRASDLLVLQAAVNIPPQVVEVTRRIPRGKGMAGLALERGRPVSTCNLQDDPSRDIRPGAKAVHAQAAVALPVPAGAEVRAVVGIAFSDERTFTDEQLDALTRAASQVPDPGDHNGGSAQ